MNVTLHACTFPQVAFIFIKSSSTIFEQFAHPNHIIADSKYSQGLKCKEPRPSCPPCWREKRMRVIKASPDSHELYTMDVVVAHGLNENGDGLYSVVASARQEPRLFWQARCPDSFGRRVKEKDQRHSNHTTTE
jgi:hypothetical protein